MIKKKQIIYFFLFLIYVFLIGPWLFNHVNPWIPIFITLFLVMYLIINLNKFFDL